MSELDNGRTVLVPGGMPGELDAGRTVIAAGGEVIPLGSIAIWTGTLATIPANWNLCDGTGVTPNLVARFIRGTPAATDPGGLGGADTHTHASMTAAGGHSHTLAAKTHSHTVNSSGDHEHQLSWAYARTTADVLVKVNSPLAGAHQHTTNTGSHSHTTDSVANHTHVISTNDGRPPYYEVAFIQAAAGAAVDANLIIIWTGTLAAIPAGWSLCDGGGARPDLRQRFIRGVNTAITNPGTTGGATTHIHTETAEAAHNHTCNNSATHNHSFNAYTWTHSHNALKGSGASVVYVQNDTGAGNHTHANSNSTGAHNHSPLGNAGGWAHTVNSASSLPAYYDVAYIINDGGATEIPTDGILIWTGTLATIPAGYNLCDGGGTTPDLRQRFTRGSNAGVDPGGTGGADSHTHTDQNTGAHTGHSQTAAGAHQHNATDTTGSHTHTITAPAILLQTTPRDTSAMVQQQAAGDHSHTYNNEDSHSNHTVSDPGNHNHNPWSTDDGRPAYYQVAFIQKA